MARIVRDVRLNRSLPLLDREEVGRAAEPGAISDGPSGRQQWRQQRRNHAICGDQWRRVHHDEHGERHWTNAARELVKGLKRAGLVIFGKTNTCELGLSVTCEPMGGSA